MEVNSAIRNIMKEILRECMNSDIQVHENFLHYYISLLALNTKWGFSNKVMTNRSDVQRFIQFVVQKLQNQNQPPMVTLKMQFYFSCNFDCRMKMIEKNRNELMIRLKHLQTEIIETSSLDDFHVDGAYRKIIYYITLASGLGNPTLSPVFLEVNAALRSILQESELIDFFEQQKFSKEEQLDEFVQLVTGIRLFNKNCGKGGEGMEDLDLLLASSIESSYANMQETLRSIMDKVNIFTTILDQIYVTESISSRSDSTSAKVHYIVCNLNKGSGTLSDVEYVKDFLILYRQYEICMRKLIQEVEKIQRYTDRIFQKFNDTLSDLHETVKDRIAIPVEQVFPQFKRLHKTWCKIQDETILLAKINQMNANLAQYVRQLPFNENVLEALGMPDPPLTDAERLEKTKNLVIKSDCHTNAELIDIHSFANLDKVRFEYLGFCAWKLVTTRCALIPGNPNMGSYKAMSQYYVFSSLEAAESFGESPIRWIMEMLEMARNRPEMINLLHLREQLLLVQDIKELVRFPEEMKISLPEESQTDMHPIPMNIDPTYMWNVWDLKRKALQLASLSKCKSKSSQTAETGQRNNAKVQTIEGKEKNENTKKDNSTNTPKPLTYIFGLRGRTDDKQFVVDLTRPVEE